MRQDMRKIINGNRIDLGVCYYPEHWDKSLWAEDLERMLAAGLKTVRIAPKPRQADRSQRICVEVERKRR